MVLSSKDDTVISCVQASYSFKPSQHGLEGGDTEGMKNDSENG